MSQLLVPAVLLVGCVNMAAGYGKYAAVDGHRLYYEIRGTGTPIVLLHGGGGNTQNSFYYQLDAFAAHHQVIGIEQRGQGHTPDVDGPLTYANMMEDTAALLEQLHVVNADIVGFSDGAILALMLGIRHPELVHRIVASGANLDPHGMTDASYKEAEDASGATVFSPAELGDYASVSPDGLVHAPVIGAKLLHLWLNHPTTEEINPGLLGQLHRPVLVMAGDRDEIKLDHTVLIYQSLPSAKLWILPGTGHPTFAQRPDWVNPMVLNFLEAH